MDNFKHSNETNRRKNAGREQSRSQHEHDEFLRPLPPLAVRASCYDDLCPAVIELTNKTNNYNYGTSIRRRIPQGYIQFDVANSLV